jgi:hypothetical protein
MTLVDEPVTAEEPHRWRQAEEESSPVEAPTPDPRPEVPTRPILATTLTSVSAALVVGGIFNSWGARLLGTFAAVVGAALGVVVLRSRRQTVAVLLVGPVLVLAASVTLIGSGPGPSNALSAARAAIHAGRLLKPPVPFDPGWRPIIFFTISLLAFGAAWVGSALERPLLGVLVPVPLVLLASFTQPPSGQLLAAAFIFLPLLAALGVIFSAGGSSGGQLDVAFELKRASKAAVFAIPAIALLVLFNSVSFLFPATTYNPNDKPQKPRPLPLSANTDQTLFTVQSPPTFTGPWRTGVLNVYQDGYFEIPPELNKNLAPVPAGGLVDAAHVASASVQIKITTADLGDSPILPTVPTQARIVLPPDAPSDIRLDSQSGVLRVTSGRAPSNLTYEIDLPPYPNALQLANAVAPPKTAALKDDLALPSTEPAGVQRLLLDAPPSGYARLDYMRHQLLDHVTAAGPGAPDQVSAAKLEDMLDGSKKATPYEIVAGEALLARYAGFPSRIAYGFNLYDQIKGINAVRPDDAAYWLEVDIAGYGWVPFLDKPPKADTSLTNPHKPDKGVVASDKVAAELFLPVALPHPVPMFELVRARLLQALPVVLVLLALRAAAPTVVRNLRRRRRELWAVGRGPRARVAVAYAEFRDAATDLNVGDPFATPIEYLARVVEDDEHKELAWLVSRCMYGDMATTVTEEHAETAQRLADSLRRRLRSGQPTQVQALAFLTQASLRRPYTEEIPNMTMPAPVSALGRRIGELRGRLTLPRVRVRRLSLRSSR